MRDNDKILKFYAGLQNKLVFEWIMNKIKNKILKLPYYQGEKSFSEKNYQTSQRKKSGRKLSLSPENCLKLYLDYELIYQNKTLHLDLVSLRPLFQRYYLLLLAFWLVRCGEIGKMFKGITHSAFSCMKT